MADSRADNGKEPLVVETVRAESGPGIRTYSDSHHVASHLELAQGKGLLGGIMLLLRLRYQAWLEERVKVLIVRKLSVREEVALKHTETLKAETQLRSTVHAGDTQVQKSISELNNARRERLISESQATVTLPIDADKTARPAPISLHISNEQIESMALRAVMSLGADAGDEQWQSYRTQLYRQVPPNVAQEVEGRILELRSIVK